MPGPIPIPIIPSLSELDDVTKRTMQSMSKQEQIETLARVLERIDRTLTVNESAPTPPWRAEALAQGLADARDDVLRVYVSLGGQYYGEKSGIL